jgi:hypothetical protein
MKATKLSDKDTDKLRELVDIEKMYICDMCCTGEGEFWIVEYPGGAIFTLCDKCKDAAVKEWEGAHEGL